MAYHQSTSQVDNSSVTVTLSDGETDSHLQPDVATVRFRLRKPKPRKKVNWTNETIDNENMDKKKSKCCCIYKKPRVPDCSSSSDDENECEHCQGHVEKSKRKPKENPSPSSTESPIQNWCDRR